MDVQIPSGLRQWYDVPVVVGRGANHTILIHHPGSEVPESCAKNLPGDALTPAQRVDLFLIASRPSEAQIGAFGALSLPEYLTEWLRPEGQVRFRGNSKQIVIDRSPCLCDDATCRKCLQVNCKDPECDVHTPQKKARFRNV